jgi:membrane protease YdiL (CAAX protease family)
MMSDMESPFPAEHLPDVGEPMPVLPPVPGPRGWRPWTAPAALFAGVVLAAVGGLIIDIPAALFFGVQITTSNKLPAGLEIVNTVVQDVAFVAAVVIFAQLGGRTLQAWQIGLRPVPIWRAVGAVLLTVVVFFIFTGIWSAAMEVSTKEELLKQLGANESTLLLIASAALTCVVAPVCEEILFRGYFFAALSNWHGWLLAAIITGVVFGGVHYGSAPVVDLVPLAFLGFALCVLYHHTRSLYPCMATHVLNNSIAFGSLEGWSAGQTALLMLAALAILGSLVLLLRRTGVIGDPPLAAAPVEPAPAVGVGA